MATLFEVIEYDIFNRFRNDYFLSLTSWSQFKYKDTDNIVKIINDRLELVLYETKDLIQNWLKNIKPEEGLTYLEYLDTQVRKNEIRDKDMLLLKYRDYITLKEITTKRELVKITDKHIDILNQTFEFYDNSYNSLVIFIEETHKKYQKGEIITDINIYKELIIKGLLNRNPVFNLPVDFKIQEFRVKGDKTLTDFDATKTTIIFLFLRKYRAILNYNRTSLSKILCPLTGFSEQNLRTASLKHLEEHFDDTTNKKLSTFNKNDLKEIRKLFQKITKEIDSILAIK
jgi:hypothetical protein